MEKTASIPSPDGVISLYQPSHYEQNSVWISLTLCSAPTMQRIFRISCTEKKLRWVCLTVK